MSLPKKNEAGNLLLHLDLLGFIEMLAKKFRFDAEKEWKDYTAED